MGILFFGGVYRDPLDRFAQLLYLSDEGKRNAILIAGDEDKKSIANLIELEEFDFL